ncbi:hypothetical protein BUALT_Bualt04G0157100 [Buddleja alternifolia]|uniref:Glycosyltransferase n=1 Tax=Buddleja alternifolia TaxID=168488 RepID=A0AAV6Y0J5_9LAMI|nr:hypothetical protein BUALT_Bualt04G0157100 [Buddleja alternifolia]
MASPHILLFPFMSKGHTIPILNLAHLLLSRGAAVTLLTTPQNRPFISTSLSHTTAASIIDIPFPQNIQGIPPGVESTDKLPEVSMWFRFAAATKLMQPQFEQILKSLPHVTFMATDGFLGWTLDSANKYGIPRLVSYGMCNFSMALNQAADANRLIIEPQPDGSEVLKIAEFPWHKFKKEDFSSVFMEPEAKKNPVYDFISEQIIATSKSYGVVVNSFYELESTYNDYWNSEFGPKAWCIGPLCLAQPKNKAENYQIPRWIEWLDKMHGKGEKVLYVAFGSQVEISINQFREIELGLEKSGVNFLWVVGKNVPQLEEGFEERVRERGIVVKEWVDQREILQHECVQGFFSHCGWNSVMESICAKVPILGWPAMADQPLNAFMVAEEMRVGLRVESCEGFVRWEGLEKVVKELMEGVSGKEARERVAEIGAAAWKAVEEGGSSWRTLNQLVNELQEKRINSVIKCN